uniref:Uncharacterized protein n=1 Tax=Sinocyclocheilus grahami TaxID=75366 RepID=A0A672SMS9_SINGR
VHTLLLYISFADVKEEDDRLHNEQPKLKNATFQIVGTDYALDMRFFPFPPHQNLKREDLLCHLMKCDVIIYDITPHADQIDEAQWAVSGITFLLNPCNETLLSYFEDGDSS